MKKPEWKNYEIAVGSLMEELGFDVQINERIEGVRGVHDIDVTARMNIGGITQLWVIECKKWNRPVPKERVLTLLGIVSDVGADRGLMFSDRGFQSGAIRAASNANVTLTSLEDFRQDAAQEIHRLRLRRMNEEINKLLQSFYALGQLTEPDRSRVLARYIGPTDILGEKSPLALTGQLTFIRSTVDQAEQNEWPVPFIPMDSSVPFYVADWPTFYVLIEGKIETCKRIYEHMTGFGGEVLDWTELQPSEMTELINRIRAN
ncbi:restriction endonuclease [Microbispora sp. SCL1-1]|uniref:restriction endonuclease n=2 Tax=Streptosporangiaceae TaxID=2004 RepID=UPI001C8E7256|nr:restriction endonuclease [Microbispora sp. SCL1-1]